MNKNICLGFASEAQYQEFIDDPMLFRDFLNTTFQQHPELFPQDWAGGFTFHDIYQSKKTNFFIRRVKLSRSGEVFSIRPSFLMPYLTARSAEVEKALYLCQFGVPLSALVYVFGRDEMFWYRLILQFGRVSLVGTTVKAKQNLPEHLAVDEKHSWLNGEKVFLPTTVAKGVFLGASVVEKADSEQLEKGYGEFQAEAAELDPEYSPKTVCTDGFPATRLVWRTLYPKITLILCYLHIILKLRDRCRSALRKEVLDRAWHIYQALTKRSFSQRARRFHQWAGRRLSPAVKEIADKLHKRCAEYLKAYDHEFAYRTSNAVDRLMNYQDRKLFAMRYFHHSNIKSARLMARAMAMIWNFHPFSQRLRRNDQTRVSPFVDLNGFQYHGNWLQNFLIASSLGGKRL